MSRWVSDSCSLLSPEAHARKKETRLRAEVSSEMSVSLYLIVLPLCRTGDRNPIETQPEKGLVCSLAMSPSQKAAWAFFLKLSQRRMQLEVALRKKKIRKITSPALCYLFSIHELPQGVIFLVWHRALQKQTDVALESLCLGQENIRAISLIIDRSWLYILMKSRDNALFSRILELL